MIVRESQLTLMHCHRRKTEDIINRSGGELCFRLYRGTREYRLDENTPVIVSLDGIARQVAPGAAVTLKPGESLTLEPGIFHSFHGAENSGDVLAGEVSAVNDDHGDNIFHEPQLRFPEIREDEPPYRLLVGDYAAIDV